MNELEPKPSSSAPAAPAAPAASVPAVSPSGASPTTGAEDRGTAFQAVEGGGETVAGGSLLVAAYAICWVVVLLFVVRVFRRQSALAREVQELEREIRARGRGDAQRSPS